MSLLSSIFGGSNKTSTATTTNASQSTTGASDEAVLAQGGSTVDQSVDYRVTDSRDLSTTVTDASRTTNSHNVTIENLAGDAINRLLDSADAYDQRRSDEALATIQGAYNNSLQFFNSSAGALREAVGVSSDGAGIVSTTKDGMKYALYLGLGLLAVVALRSM